MTEVPAATTWGPVHWDSTLAGLERCVRDLREAGAPGDGVITVAYASYLSRRLSVKPVPPERRGGPVPATAEEKARRQREGRRHARGRP